MRRMVFLLLGLTAAVLMFHQNGQASSTSYPITNIDPGGLVTVTDLRSKQTFQFQVADPKLLSTLKVGQLVYPDFHNQKVSLDGRNPCCSMVNPQSLRAPLERNRLRPSVQPGGIAPDPKAARPLNQPIQIPPPVTVPQR